MTPQDLIAAFETLGEAPDGVKRLRELVLQLAVRGKLVPQDPEDEPANVLLERIATEKARLVKEKKIRKPKVLPPIEADEVPFDLPCGWTWARVEQFVEQVTDGVHKTPTYVESGVPFLSIKDISAGFLDFSNTRFVTRDAHEKMCRRCRPERNDILFCRIGTLGRALVIDSDKEFSIFVSLGLLKMAGHLNPRFVQNVLNSPASYEQYDRIKAGGSHTNKLNLGTMRSAIMPIAPLAEQHRIVARVDELMGLLDRLEAARDARDGTRTALRDAALAALRDADDAEAVTDAWARIAEHMEDLFTDPADVAPLRQAILQLAVRGRLVPQDPGDEPASVLLERIAAEKARLVKEKKIRKPKVLPPIEAGEVPFAVPEGWAWSRFGVVTDSRLGKMLDKSKNRGPLRPYLRNANLQWFRFELDDVKLLRLEEAELDECTVAVGDLAICEGGEPGRCAVVDTRAAGMVYQKALHRARPMGGVVSWYLAYLLRSDATGGRLAELFTGATIKHLTGRSLARYSVPLPPVAEQHRIVAKVDALMALCDDLEARLTAARDAQTAFASAAVHHLDA